MVDLGTGFTRLFKIYKIMSDLFILKNLVNPVP